MFFRLAQSASPARLHIAALALSLAASGPAGAEEPASLVTVIVAEKTDGIAREFSLTGTVTARREARLSSRTEGLVAEVKVDAGSLVREGDTLLVLDTRLGEITLDRIRAERTAAEIAVAEAKRRAEEVRELSRTGGFPKTEAEARVAEQRLREAEWMQLQVREEEQGELLARHSLVAPFGGVIRRKLAEAGEWVDTGTPVLELVETENPRFDLQVPQEFLERISRAVSFRVKLDAFPETLLEAEVEAMVPVKDPSTRTFLTRLSLKDARKLAAPGMSGTATVTYRTGDSNSVRIPRDAVVRFPDGSIKVWIVGSNPEGDRVASRAIRTGGSLGEYTEVVEGLEGGERVVLKGNEGLHENQAVRVEAGPEAPAP